MMCYTINLKRYASMLLLFGNRWWLSNLNVCCSG